MSVWARWGPRRCYGWLDRAVEMVDGSRKEPWSRRIRGGEVRRAATSFLK
jgi:hypothetical protein